MRIGVHFTSTLPGRGSIACISVTMLFLMSLSPLFVDASAAEPENGTFMGLKPVRTSYWIKCPSGDAVMDGNLTPAPLTGRDGTSEVVVPGPTFPKRTLSRIGIFSLEFESNYWGGHRFELHGIEGVSIWAEAFEDVEDAQFRIIFSRYGNEFANLYTETKNLDNSPKELRVTESVSFDEPIIFDGYEPLEVEIQYKAASRTLGGPAPDCVFLSGSLIRPSRVVLSVIPMNMAVYGGYYNSEQMWVYGSVSDSSNLDPEEQLEYDLRIYDPHGDQIDPITIEQSSVYVGYDEVTVIWDWSYNLTKNVNGSYQFQMEVSYGVPGVTYSNTTEFNLYFDDTGMMDADYDGDGYPNNEDEFPWDPDEWEDTDDDGVGDNGDEFPNDANETKDTDGDGVGDNGDAFPLDHTEWCDSDEDGYGNNCDRFPDNATEWKDTDNDGYGDNCDCFPADSNEWCDSDGDGVGDNGDDFPADATEWLDTDGDGHGDTTYLFPRDASEWADTDGDGHGDNGDDFPDDRLEWRDSDGDGYGDNSDAFPYDDAEWSDADGDGTGDNGDVFPDDATEWVDTDGDGHGDNSDAFPADPAASMDTDGDDHPDQWNTGMAEGDSTTGLGLDEYPYDKDRWEEEPVGPLGGGELPIDTTTAFMALVIVALLVVLAVFLRRKPDQE